MQKPAVKPDSKQKPKVLSASSSISAPASKAPPAPLLSPKPAAKPDVAPKTSGLTPRVDLEVSAPKGETLVPRLSSPSEKPAFTVDAAPTGRLFTDADVAPPSPILSAQAPQPSSSGSPMSDASKAAKQDAKARKAEAEAKAKADKAKAKADGKAAKEAAKQAGKTDRTANRQDAKSGRSQARLDAGASFGQTAQALSSDAVELGGNVLDAYTSGGGAAGLAGAFGGNPMDAATRPMEVSPVDVPIEDDAPDAFDPVAWAKENPIPVVGALALAGFAARKLGII